MLRFLISIIVLTKSGQFLDCAAVAVYVRYVHVLRTANFKLFLLW